MYFGTNISNLDTAVEPTDILQAEFVSSDPSLLQMNRLRTWLYLASRTSLARTLACVFKPGSLHAQGGSPIQPSARRTPPRRVELHAHFRAFLYKWYVQDYNQISIFCEPFKEPTYTSVISGKIHNYFCPDNGDSSQALNSHPAYEAGVEPVAPREAD